MEEFLVKFGKPYQFEGDEYTEIDLSGLESLKAQDIIEVEKQFAATGQVAPVNEMTVGYACLVAARVTGKPDLFFTNLPARESLKIKNVVMVFFCE
jgi:hypothetical protein